MNTRVICGALLITLIVVGLNMLEQPMTVWGVVERFILSFPLALALAWWIRHSGKRRDNASQKQEEEKG